MELAYWQQGTEIFAYLLEKTFHLYSLVVKKNEIKTRNKTESSFLEAAKNTMRNCNLRVRLGVRKTSSIYVEALQFPVLYHSRTPPTHTHTHIRKHTRVQVGFRLSSSSSKKKKKNQSKTTERKVAESTIREWRKHMGEGGADMWRKHQAIIENYEDVYGSVHLKLYFKNATILWYSVAGTSGGRQAAILQNKTDFLSQFRLMTWKSCTAAWGRWSVFGPWNVCTHYPHKCVHLWGNLLDFTISVDGTVNWVDASVNVRICEMSNISFVYSQQQVFNQSGRGWDTVRRAN